jgi:hypothetical protein
MLQSTDGVHSMRDSETVKWGKEKKVKQPL